MTTSGRRPATRVERIARWMPRSLFAARGPAGCDAIALTFDDGPHPVITPRVLDALAAARARATFFLVGANARKHPELVDRVVSEGHEIACHTENHVDLSRCGARAAHRECSVCRDYLQNVTGMPVRHLRPPWGRMSLTTLPVAVLSGMSVVLWSIDSRDYSGLGAAELVSRVEQHEPTGGDIILFHDDAENTSQALPSILRCLSDRNLGCQTVSEMLRQRKPNPLPRSASTA